MNFKSIIKGTLISLILIVVALFSGALLVYNNLLSEKTVSIIVFCVTAVSIFIGAYGVAKASEHRILFNSLCVALLFFMIVFILSLLINNGIFFHIRTVALYLTIFASAFLGAIFGK